VGDPAEAVEGATPALGLIEASSRVTSRVTYVTEPGSMVPAADMRIEDVPNQGCEVCIYVLENKNNNNPFLCRNVRNPKFQQDVSVKSLGGGGSSHCSRAGMFEGCVFEGRVGEGGEWRRE
jgi:hypothetical protein